MDEDDGREQEKKTYLRPQRHQMRRLGRLWSSPLTVAPWVPSKHSEGLNQNRNHYLVKKKHEEKKNTYLRPKRRIWRRLGLLWSSPSTVAHQVPEKNSEDLSS